MVYCCKECGFLFQRIGNVEECPFCEGKHFRRATEEETQRLRTILNKQAGSRKEQAG